ncbi:MAG: 3-dehydroquinate synthase [Armatimonadota bacterium]|nr:3-dehydroquinate synthase [Armatimonadota bacterium]
MIDVPVNLGSRSYVVTIGADVLSKTGRLIAEVGRPSGVMVVSDRKVARLYAQSVLSSLADEQMHAELFVVPCGERYKTLATVRRIYEALVKAKMDRTSAVVALGGGVVGDMVGFAAATYMRGVDFYQVPTTLLAQVDAAVGGKTGVDLAQGKNLVGAFYQPRRVIIDTLTLKTLPMRELRAGLAEVVKHGIICDKVFFEFVRENARHLLARREDALREAIRRSVEIKRDVVQQDERESGLRAVLNYGHTVGHAIEAATGYVKYKHGEAVAVGMVAEALIAERGGVTEESVLEPVRDAVCRLGLPSTLDPTISAEDLLQAMELDKKVRAGEIRMALPVRIGKCSVFTIERSNVLSALREFCAIGG